MNDEPPASVPPSSAPPSAVAARARRREVLERIASIGASAQAAIPGMYAWAVTVAPAAWSRGAPLLAKVAAIVGVLALASAPLVEGRGAPAFVGSPPPGSGPRRAPGVGAWRAWTGRTWARAWSVWGLVLSSVVVWALTPSALSSARLDGVRGAFGMIGWGLFAFASAGPVLRSDPAAAARIVASRSLAPRSGAPRGGGLYIGGGVVLALAMQAVGWGVAAPERSLLVRLVTVVCGIAVLGAMTTVSLGRHAAPDRHEAWLRLKRALPWLVLLALVAIGGLSLGPAR